MNNTINYTGLNATIEFDATDMTFIGYINKNMSIHEFRATSISELKKQYESLSKKINEAQDIRNELATQLISIEEIIQSGEAKIFIDPSYTELKLGVMIKTLLNLSDGAAFKVAEKNINYPNTGISI